MFFNFNFRIFKINKLYNTGVVGEGGEGWGCD